MSQITDRINELIPLVKEILDNAEDPEKLEEWQQELYDELETLQGYLAEDGGEVVKAEAVLVKTEAGADLIRKSPVGKSAKKRKRSADAAAGSTSTAPTAAGPASTTASAPTAAEPASTTTPVPTAYYWLPMPPPDA